MKITVSKNDLEPVLKAVSVGLGPASVSGILDPHFVFSLEGKRLNVWTGHNRVSACASFRTDTSVPEDQHLPPVDVEGDEPFTVEGWRLLHWLENSEAGNSALTLEYKESDKVVIATDSVATQCFTSLDARQYPFWGDDLSSAEERCKVASDVLSGVIAYTKHFVSDRETSHPQLTVVELRKGCLYATDEFAVCVTSVPDMDKCGCNDKTPFRIQRENLGSVQKFLTQFKGFPVTVLESEKGLFLACGGCILFVSKWAYAFPNMVVRIDAESLMYIKLNREALKRVITRLRASATTDSDQDKITLKDGKAANQIIVTVKTPTGKWDEIPINASITLNPQDGVELNNLPVKGLTFNKKYLLQYLDSVDGTDVIIGVDYKARKAPTKGMYIRCPNEDNGVKTLTIILSET